MWPNPINQRLFRGLLIAVAGAVFLSQALFSAPAAWQGLFLPLIGRDWPTEPPFSSALLVTEVLPDPKGEQPAGEWFEIYNRGESQVDLGSFKIGDGETQGDGEGMFRFPTGTLIAPGEVIVIANQATVFSIAYGFNPDFELAGSDDSVPDLIKYSEWARGSVNLSNTGDEVIILNEENIIIDAVSWGDSTFAFDPAMRRVSSGHSLERKPAYLDSDSEADWIDQPWPAPGVVNVTPPTSTPTRLPTFTPTGTGTPTATPAPCNQATALISEVLYDPVGAGDPDGEWVEIYNPGELALNLACIRVGDEETSGGGEGMYAFPDGFHLAAHSLIVVANRASAFLEANDFPPDFEVFDTDPAVPDMVDDAGWSNGSMNLSNAGDEVLILDLDNQPLDMLSWGSSTFAFDPAVETVPAGHSLERLPADQDNDSAFDWVDRANPAPGEATFSSETPSPTGSATSTPTETPVPCGPASLLITELYTDPTLGNEPQGEWFEIFNPSDEAVNLACIKAGDEETSGEGEAMLGFPGGDSLDPGKVIVIANQASAFLNEYGFLPDYEAVNSMEEVPDMFRYTAWANGSLSFSNSGDEILILDENDLIVDAISWGSSTFAFDPSVKAPPEGYSLERCPADGDSDRAVDWQPQSEPVPGQVNLDPPAFTATPTRTRTTTPTPTRTRTPAPTSTRTRTPTPTRTVTPNSGLVINEIFANPVAGVGDANGDGIVDEEQDAFVEIVNTRGTSYDLSGWTVRDALAVRHTFPAGSIVPVGSAVVVFGGGTPTGSFGDSLVLTASTGYLGFNVNGDIVNVVDANGVIVATYSYHMEGGEGQSVTRDPDITGPEPLVKHSTAAGSGGRLFSPGTRVDGTNF